MRFLLCMLLAGMTGFIALSYEILWVRMYSFASGSRAWVFGVFLGSYLLGIALGSLVSLRFRNPRRRTDRSQLGAIAVFVLLANAVGFFLIPVVSWVNVLASFAWTFPLVTAAAGMLGACLPLVCHYAIPADERAGAGLSYLYLSNIVGAGLGSLVTGFLLMDLLSTAEIATLLALLGIFLSVALSLLSLPRPPVLLRRLLGAFVLALAIALSGPYLFDGLYERLQLGRKVLKKGTDYRFRHVIESRHGVLTADEWNRLYGGGVFDGKFRLGLDGGDWIVRPYTVSALHPAPRKVLMIGLGTGAWTKIVAHNVAVEEITVVEISPDYREIISRYPVVADVLDDPKVRIVIDDGRRWLVRRPDETFDVIIANTTFHWRSHATHLLSVEFLRLVRAHLADGGIYLFNATGSRDAERTAMAVFPHTMNILNNVACSDGPLVFDRHRWRENLAAYTYGGRPLFDRATPAGRRRLDAVLALADTLDRPDDGESFRLRGRAQMAERCADAEIITDDNMASEWWGW